MWVLFVLFVVVGQVAVVVVGVEQCFVQQPSYVHVRAASASFAAGALAQVAGAPTWTWWALYLAPETVVARIAALIEEASATKARTQLFVEKVEQRYSIATVAATVAVFAVPLAFGAT